MFVGSVSDGSGAPAPGWKLAWGGDVPRAAGKTVHGQSAEGGEAGRIEDLLVNLPFIATPLGEVAATLLNAGAML